MIRGLFRFVVWLALAGGVLWFALPAAASGLAGAAVGAAGLSGDHLTTSVVARPPWKLLLLEADAVHVTSGPGTWRGSSFGGLDVTVAGLGLGSPPATIEGRIDDVEFASAPGVIVRAGSIALSGAATTPDVVARVARSEVSALVGRVLPAQFGGPETRITLAPPDGVRIATPSGDVTARIVARGDGGLDLVVEVPGAGALVLCLLEQGGALPVHVGSVDIAADDVVLRGTVDASSLGL